MTEQKLNPESDAGVNVTPPFKFRRAAIPILNGVTAFLIGAVPFVLGFAIQAVTPRRLPAYVIGLLSAALSFTFKHFMGFMPVVKVWESTAWPSIAWSVWLFIVCFSIGAELLRALLPGRFSKPPAPPIHNESHTPLLP